MYKYTDIYVMNNTMYYNKYLIHRNIGRVFISDWVGNINV